MGTVSKALSLLGYFSRERNLIGLTEMARLSGLNKATVHRLLGELQNQGYVEQTGSGREYRLGPVFLRLAALREAEVPTREVARKALIALSDATGETAHMSMLQGRTLSVVAYAHSSKHGTHVSMADAEVISLHATSSGQAVLAFSDATLVDRVLGEELVKYTAQTETDPARIRARLDEIRASGVAESVSGFEADVHSHSCPLFDARQICIGAMAVAAPVARMTPALRQTIRAEVPAAALGLTRTLGGFAPPAFTRTLTSHAAA